MSGDVVDSQDEDVAVELVPDDDSSPTIARLRRVAHVAPDK